MRNVTVSLAALALALAMPAAAGAQDGEVLELDEAVIRVEVNDTDGDAGIQIFLDGEGWRTMRVIDPDGHTIFDVEAFASGADLGFTELFTESEEPAFEEGFSLQELFELFPAGEYAFSGETTDGEDIVGMATFTHDIPGGPVVFGPAGDGVDPDDTVISWAPPAASLAGDPEIVAYQVIVEREDPLRVFSVDLPADARSLTVSPEFMEPGTEYAFEVLAIEASGNQTITEVEFETAEEDGEEEPGPPPPSADWLTAPLLGNFRVQVQVSSDGDVLPTRQNLADCDPETVCVSGAVPGRIEVLVRVPGPKPNGCFWPTVTKLTTSTVEVWVERVSTGQVNYYRVPGASPGSSDLPGFFDRDGFCP